MFCTVCGEWGDLRHFDIVDGEVVCRTTYNYFCGIDESVPTWLGINDLSPAWLGGSTNEEGEVYGG